LTGLWSDGSIDPGTPWERTKAMAASISDIRLLLKIKKIPRCPDSRRVFITGGTGHVGSALIPVLLERGHRVRALVRSGSKARLPADCEVVTGDALVANSYRQLIRPSDTFVHLVGIPRRSEAKVAEFRSIDMAPLREAIDACAELGVHHFIYLSDARPAPMTKDQIAVRVECERMLSDRQLNSTIIHPSSVVGPRHPWAFALLPLYNVGEWLPFARAAALRLGLITLDQLIIALVDAVESPVQGSRILDVPEIRAASLRFAPEATRKSA
jgi:uncharacterized protein YbjT (DUF2867 family)